MIEFRCSFGFTAETNQRMLRIGVISQNALYRDDAPRVPLPRAINDAHAAAPDLFENLVITQPPIGVAHIDSSEHVLERFMVASISAQTLIQQTGQTETAPNP